MPEQVRESYQQRLQQYTALHLSAQKQLTQLGWLRLLAFLAIIPAFIYSRQWGTLAIIIAITAPLSVFLWLVKKYIQKEKQKEFYNNLINLNKNELLALDGDFSVFENGNEYSDAHHAYSLDLDLFGARSFFQFMNRSSTIRGKNRLAAMLQNGELDVTAITTRQQATDELAGILDWRQSFAAKGKTNSDQQDHTLINQWSHSSFILKHEKTLRVFMYVLPILTISAIALAIFQSIPWEIVTIMVLFQWGFYLPYSKTIRRFHQLFGSRATILSRYIDMLSDIEKHDFQSELLITIKHHLYFEKESASQISGKLKKGIDKLEYGQNLFVSIILNSILLWDIRCIYHLSQWHRRYHEQLNQWFEVIAEFDALSSLANFNYNHPAYVFPLPVIGDARIEAEQLGHPMIDAKKRICNDFELSGSGKLAIITGANMAGKSTFLRTVGINLILAMNGCRVCASNMKFSPISLFTNMRTTDNLMNDESYFYAELLRLQQLLQRIRQGEKLFVIVDEMLKGTNSEDKLQGSKALVKQLISLGATGIIATHDLKLTELESEYPSAIQNQCFEVLLHHDELQFDYLLRTGVTRTMNASFLMKKMGIIAQSRFYRSQNKA